MEKVREGVREEIGSVPDSLPAILWGVLSTQTIMAQYINDDMKNHPAILSEYVTFLVTHPRIGPVESVSKRVDEIEATLKSHKKDISGATTAASTASSKVTNMEKVIKELQKKLKGKVGDA